MKLIAWLTSAALLTPCFVSAQVTRPVTPDQIKSSGLETGYRLEEYYSELYTARSSVGPVFFDQEPIVFKLVITNVDSTATALVFATTDGQRLVQVRGFVAPPRPENAPERRWSANKFDDERCVGWPRGITSVRARRLLAFSKSIRTVSTRMVLSRQSLLRREKLPKPQLIVRMRTRSPKTVEIKYWKNTSQDGVPSSISCSHGATDPEALKPRGPIV